MILQALYEYYQRKAADPESHIAPEGFQWQPLKFVIVIDRSGKFVSLDDLRNEDGEGKLFLLPKAKSRSGKDAWKKTFLLWDHYGYVLGHPMKDDAKSKEIAKKQLKTFSKNLQDLPKLLKKDPAVEAVLSFYDQGEPALVKKHPLWIECAKIPRCNLTFRIDGDEKLIPERDAVVEYQKMLLTKAADEENGETKTITGRCLITGEREPIIRLHTPTSIRNSKSNARLVAFQKNSGYDSYKKEQAYNAPTSIKAESAYTTALKQLISSESNKVLIADATIIFWADKKKPVHQSYDLESAFPWFLTDQRDDPDRNVNVVKSLYEAAYTGKLAHSDEQFYVLALAPNAARISVRFFRRGTVKDFGEKIKQHFDDLQIEKPEYERDYPTLYELLASVSTETKDRKKSNIIYYRGKYYDVTPNLASAVVESILDGTPYPRTILQQCIRRIRAEAAKQDQNGKPIPNVTRARAAILKATINRFNRIHNKYEKEILMALDPTNKDVAYLLGRLFALLERIQEESAKPTKLNSTIRERYYASFSSSPPVVMPLLMKLKNHHLAKLGGERDYLKRWFEQKVGEVVNLLEGENIPSHLTLQEQAQFAVGYYHQRMYREQKQS